ncbi:MAG: cyclase family protein [Elusimicrobiota bacterium]|jgi:arylformamidase|nr:cyclase family protein [Elusimicrobiota bacterium]
MEIIDISRIAQEAPLYPDAPAPEVVKLQDVNEGALYSVSRFVFASHIGTHADAFSHFVAGLEDIEQIPLDYYYGEAKVVSVPENSLIAKKELEGKIDGIEKLIIRGGGQSYLSKEAADYIISKKIKTIVTDAWSIAPLDNEQEIHQAIFRAKIAVIENVILDGVKDGKYILSAFPIKIKGADGSPVRAALIKE